MRFHCLCVEVKRMFEIFVGDLAQRITYSVHPAWGHLLGPGGLPPHSLAVRDVYILNRVVQMEFVVWSGARFAGFHFEFRG